MAGKENLFRRFIKRVDADNQQSLVEARRRRTEPPLETTLPDYHGKPLFEIPAFTLDLPRTLHVYKRLGLQQVIKADTPTVIILPESKTQERFGPLENAGAEDTLARQYRDATVKFTLEAPKSDAIQSVMKNMPLTSHEEGFGESAFSDEQIQQTLSVVKGGLNQLQNSSAIDVRMTFIAEDTTWRHPFIVLTPKRLIYS